MWQFMKSSVSKICYFHQANCEIYTNLQFLGYFCLPLLANLHVINSLHYLFPCQPFSVKIYTAAPEELAHGVYCFSRSISILNYESTLKFNYCRAKKKNQLYFSWGQWKLMVLKYDGLRMLHKFWKLNTLVCGFKEIR